MVKFVVTAFCPIPSPGLPPAAGAGWGVGGRQGESGPPTPHSNTPLEGRG